MELKLLNECTELMKEYKDGMDSNIKDPFMEEINSELIDFQEYLNNMKKLKTKSFYNEIANSIKTIDKTNLSNNVSSKFLKSIDKKLSGYPSEEKKGFKNIKMI